MDKKGRILRLNIISSLIFQVVYALTGLIHPKLLLAAFGSELYGLTLSVARFLSLMSLAEGGITAVVAANLYKPLANKDNKKVSEIVDAADIYYRRIGLAYLVYALLMGFIYPLFVKGYGTSLVLPLSILSALPTVMAYFTWRTLRSLVSADERSYIVNAELSITAIVNVLFVFIATRISKDVLFIKFATFLAYIVQPLIYYYYCKKEYNFLKRKLSFKKQGEPLPQRRDGFSHSLADYIHGNTDYYVLTLFSNLVNVAIYGVYEMVIASLRNAVSSIATSLSPSFGKIFASKNKEESRDFFDEYEQIVNFLIVIIFSCVAVLLIPFVKIYTADIHDANYVYPLFGAIFTIAGISDCLRLPYIEASRAAGRFKETKIIAYGEAAINLILSVILVIKYDLVGVVIATSIAMSFRAVAEGIYVSNNILDRSIFKLIYKFIICIGCIALNYFVCSRVFSYDVNGYLGWFIVAIKTGLLSLAITSAIYYIFDRKTFMRTIKVLMNKEK